ncbi:MAG: SDR family NAD(P)-dependent oxidoreductase [Nitratireductor sp.]
MAILSNKIAVVTGASRGIGYHAALSMAEAGAHIIAIAKTVGGLEALDDEIKAKGGTATLVPMDLQDFDAIDRLGAAIHEKWGKLDILVANAGILGGLSPLGHIAPKKFDQLMNINVTANWRLIRSLDPLLQKSDAGRALFLSSGAPHSCKAFWGGYAASKAAVEALARVYANENANTNLNANIINPGATRTKMRAQAMPGEDPQSIPHPSELGKDFVMLSSDSCAENGKIFDCHSQSFKTPQAPI